MPPSVVESSSFFFDVIVVSCPDILAARACIGGTLRDLVRYLNNAKDRITRATRGAGLSSSQDHDPGSGGESWLITDDGRTILGATCDPNGQKCGSGGGTIACYEYARQLYAIMASNGTTLLDASVADIRVLIIHGGGHSSRCPSQMVLGKAWTTLLTCNNTSSSSLSCPRVELTCPALKIIQLMQKLFFYYSSSNGQHGDHFGSYLPPGSVVISSGDALITLDTTTSQGQHQDLVSHLHEQLLQYWQPPQKQQLQQALNAVIGLAVPAATSVATNHGVFIVHDTVTTPTTNATSFAKSPVSITPVFRYLQKPPLQDLDGITTAWIDTGVVIFLPQAAQILQQLGGLDSVSSHVAPLPPLLQYCTRDGFTTTKTASVVPIDLYSHIMPALATIGTSTATTNDGYDQKLEKYLSLVGCSTGESSTTRDLLLSELYKIFHTVPFHVITCPKGQFTHLGTTRELLTFFTSNTSVNPNLPLGRPRRAISFLNPKHAAVTIDPSTVTINVLFSTNDSSFNHQQNGLATNVPPKSTITVGSHCVLEHCHLQISQGQTFEIGHCCLLSGIKAEFFSSKLFAPPSSFTIASGMMVQQVPLKPNWRKSSTFALCSEEEEAEEDFAIIALHVDDPIQSLTNSIYGMDLQKFLSWTSNALTETDIWPDDVRDGDIPRTLWHAKIHPVVSRNRRTQPILPVNFSAIIGWLSQLMNRHQQRKEINCKDEDYNLMQDNIKAWKEMERLSLSQICQLSDACTEYASRRNLTVKIKSAYETTVDEIYQNVQLRSSLLPNNTAPFIESFAGGDFFPFEVLYHRLLQCATDKSNSQIGGNKYLKYDYDNLSRSCMVLVATLNDVAETLRALYESTVERSDLDCTLIEDFPCPSSLQCSMEHIIERIRMSYHHYPLQFCVVEEACASLRTVLFQFLVDGLRCQQPCGFIKVLTTCTNYLEICASAFTEVFICASSEISVKRISSPAPLNQWVLATSAGRVDIAGGFSDLPPIFYEHGGSVVGVAVAVDGVKPLSARCRRLHGGDGLHLVSEARSLEDGSLLYRYETHVTTLQDLMDYRDLNSGACLLKSSVICLGIIPLSAIHGDVETLKNPIQPYLDSFFCPSEDEDGGMIELVSTSLLPRGSGMGSSSLLSACVLSAICRCAGVKLVCTHHGSDTNKLSDEEIWTHTVLALEQIMHSAGGYQDQTNIVGGFKVARATAGKIPIEIKIERLEFTQVKELNERLVLVYSGTPRVAKNLLSCVLRRWSKHTDDSVSTMNQLVHDAEEAALALTPSFTRENVDQDGMGLIEQLGKFMLEYRKHKKIMIGDGAEPREVTELISILQTVNAISGAILLGAGGGGFLALIAAKGLKGMDLKNIAESEVLERIKKHEMTTSVPKAESAADIDDKNSLLSILEQCTWHSCTVCEEGLQVGIIDSKTDFGNDCFSLDWHKQGRLAMT